MTAESGKQTTDFPSLPAPAEGEHGRAARVCLATNEVIGPDRGGGVGTVFTTLAQALARAGHEATLLYIPGRRSEDRSLEHWIEHYARQGVRLLPLPECKLRFQVETPRARSHTTYLWLKAHENEFDVIHFADWCGAGYDTLLAKRLGLAFAHTQICIGTHGPRLWVREAGCEYLHDVNDLTVAFQEQQSVELADVVISPSQYMIGWIRKRGWQLPPRTFVQPNPLPRTTCPTAAGRHTLRANNTGLLAEFVFFGRLENRKGVPLLCDALDRLAKRGIKGFSVTFLGREAVVEGQPAGEYLKDRSRNWPFAWRIIGNRNQPEAIEFLRGEGRLAVIPSLDEAFGMTVLECIGAGIPFLASRAGGIPEVIAEADHDQVLFAPAPRALADRLARALREGVQPARAAVDPEGNERTWVAWHAHLPPASRAGKHAAPRPAAKSEPLVSVCIAVHDESRRLPQARSMLEAQSYSKFEVLLTDPRQAAGKYLLLMNDRHLAKPDMLSTLVSIAEKTGADILTCGIDYFEGEEIPDNNSSRVRRWLPLGPAISVGAYRNCFGGAIALVRRDTLLAMGGFAEGHGLECREWEFYARALLTGRRLEAVPEALFWCRLDPADLSGPATTYQNHIRSTRPYRDALPDALRDMLLLAQGLHMGAGALVERLRAERDHYRVELNRYKAGLEAVLKKPPIRAYRALKRILGSLAGKQE